MTTFNATKRVSDDPYGPRGFPQATIVLAPWQRWAGWGMLASLLLWALFDWRQELLVINVVFAIFFLLSTLYRVMLIDASLRRTREIVLGPEDLREPPNGKEWPKYVVILPMYHEGDVVGKLVDGLRKLDYPVDRLEVRLLIEEDDLETMTAAKALDLQPPFVITPIPASYPRTKPKACNVGIQEGDFDYLVIYDAEDQPETDQLKKAAVAFSRCPDNVACIQGKLCFYNSTYNLLTRLFTVDYSTWFGLCLPGLDAYEAPIPLGGTSNHFRLDVLREVGGWDEYNVTEDCDLGLRLFLRGWRTRVLDSTLGTGVPHGWLLGTATLPLGEGLCADLPGAHPSPLGTDQAVGLPQQHSLPPVDRRFRVQPAHLPLLLAAGADVAGVPARGAHPFLPRARFRDGLPLPLRGQLLLRLYRRDCLYPARHGASGQVRLADALLLDHDERGRLEGLPATHHQAASLGKDQTLRRVRTPRA